MTHRHLLLPAAALLLGLVGCGDPCPESGTVCTIVGDGSAAFNGDEIKASKATLYYPTDVTAWPGKDAFVITDWNNEKIREVDEDGVIRTIVGANIPGDGAPGGGDRVDPGAPGTATRLNHPIQTEFGPDGMLYISAWHNHKIRRWDPEADLTRIIVANTDPEDGNGSNSGFAGDGGPAEDALIWFPHSLAFLPDGSFCFVDERNLRVRHVDNAGNIDTLAGSGEPGKIDGTLAEATFHFPDVIDGFQPLPGGSIETDEFGTIYLADTFNHAIRRIDPGAGTVTTVAGTGTPGYSGDGGDATLAQLNAPYDVEFGPDGRLYISDTFNHVIRALDVETGVIETVAGTGDVGDGEDGLPALEGALNQPYGIDFMDDGAMLIADTYNSKIRRVTP